MILGISIVADVLTRTSAITLLTSAALTFGVGVCAVMATDTGEAREVTVFAGAATSGVATYAVDAVTGVALAAS